MGVGGAVVALLMPTQTADPAAFTADVAGRKPDVHQGADGAVVVVAPDDALLVGRHRLAAAAVVLGLGDPFRRLGQIGLADTADRGPFGQGHLAGRPRRFERAERGRVLFILGHRDVALEGGGGDEVGVHPALVGDVGEERVEQRKVSARGDLKMHDVVSARDFLAGVDRHGAARIDDQHARPVPHPRHHVVQEQVGLRLDRVGADQEDRVGHLVVGVLVVQLVHAHVAGRVDFRVVGRAVVDAAVLDLHRTRSRACRCPRCSRTRPRCRRGRTSRRNRSSSLSLSITRAVTRATRSSASSQVVGCQVP